MGLSAMDVPWEWTKVLKVIQGFAPEAFIGGGALRDLYHNRRVKDLDVFVPAHRWDYAPAEALWDGGYFCSKTTPMAYLGADPTVAESIEYVHSRELDLNVILLNSGYELPSALDRFDLGLCQIGFDGREVFSTEGFERDSRNHTMTVCRADDLQQLDRTKRRAARLSLKYRGYPLIIPPEFNHTA